jgi:hypothetical protein
MDLSKREPGDHQRHIRVRVITTSGSFPRHGHETVGVNEPVSEILKRAANALGIADTSEWVAKVDGKEVQVDKTYMELGLHGEVKIDYGRREGGGGHAS